MIELAAYAAILLFLALAIFQISLACGAPLGHFAWGGAHRILPAKLRVGSIIAVVLYGIFSLLILSSVGVVGVFNDERVLNTGMWITTAYFALGVLMNAISKSKPERLVMTPVSLVLTLLFLAVILL